MEVSIDSRHWHSAAMAPQHGAQQQMCAVSCCQLRDEVEHRLVVVKWEFRQYVSEN